MPDEDPADLIDLLTPELREGVEAGRYIITAPGQNNRPVVVDAETGRWVTGSGRPLNANDPAYIGKVTAYKRSRAYNEALEQLIPAWAEDGETPEAVFSLQELLQAARRLALPEKVKHTEMCPCGCGVEVTFIVDKAPDQKMVAFLIERLAGAAQKTTQVNIHSEELLRVMNDTRVLQTVEFVALTPEARAARIRAIQEAS